WSLANTLELLERYNGLGYRNKGLPSPYLWAGTDQYQKGKYVKDGKFDSNHVDQQLGVAPILMKLREAAAPVQPAPIPTVPLPDPKPGGLNPAGAIAAIVILAALAAAFFLITQVRF